MDTHRWAVIGDLHLNKLQSLIPDHLQRQRRTLDAILQEAVAQDLKHVILLGDVFDTPKPATPVILGLLDILHDWSDLEFIWLVGNHDRHSRNPAHVDIFGKLAKEHFKNLTIIDTPTQRGNISWLPYPHKTPFDKTDLVFAHVDRPGARYDNNYVVPGEPWDKKHRWIIGHIHKPQRMGTHTYYPGSPWQLSFGESPDKHWAQVSAKGSGKSFRIKYIPHSIVPSYTLVTVDVSKEKHFSKLSKRHHAHPDTWYKARIKNGIHVPATFFLEHPRCLLDLQPGPSKQSPDVQGRMDSGGALSINPLDGLEDYLAAAGLSKSQIDWAINTAQQAFSETK